MQDKSFLEHLEDFRWVIIKSSAVLALGVVISCFHARELVAFLRLPLDRVLAAKNLPPDSFLIILGVVDPLTLMLQIGFFTGVILSSPFIFFFLGQFLIPALQKKERRIIYPIFLSGGLLFLAGVAFCYFLVLPQTVRFFLDFNSWFGWEAKWTIQNYLNFTLQMLLAFGISFELPLVLVTLMALKIFTPSQLAQYRRHTVVILVIFAACVTPTSDPFNLSLLFFPMYILFEASILIGRSWRI